MINFAFIAIRKACQNLGAARHVFAIGIAAAISLLSFFAHYFPWLQCKTSNCNRLAIDLIGRKTGVIVIDYDYPKLIHTIVIVIVIEWFLWRLHISLLLFIRTVLWGLTNPKWVFFNGRQEFLYLRFIPVSLDSSWHLLSKHWW
jgi:hypothetical protein